MHPALSWLIVLAGGKRGRPPHQRVNRIQSAHKAQQPLFEVSVDTYTSQPLPCEKFEETWHDAGKTDMLACMQAYKEIGFEGVLRPDHVPTVAGDNNADAGYSSFGRLYALGYIRGLRQAVNND